MRQLNVSTLGFLAFLLALTAGAGLLAVALDSLRGETRGEAGVVPVVQRDTPGGTPRAEPVRVPRQPERAGPERPATSLVFRLDCERARLEGRPEASTDAQVIADTLGVLRRRLDAAGFSTLAMEDLGGGRFEIVLPPAREAEAEGVIALTTASGDLEFRMEVLPDARYRDDEGDAPYKRQRSRLWDGTEEAFDAYKAAEVKAWQEAQASGTAFVPSRKGLRLVPSKGVPPDAGVHAFHVVEEPESPGERFGGAILENPDVGRGDRGEPVTVFEVKREHQAAFSAWTGKNVRLPLAILMNGEYVMAPTINSPLSDRIQVTLGSQSFAEAKRQAEELRLTLGTGSLPCRPVLVAREKVKR